MTTAIKRQYGRWLRDQRQARGWDVPAMRDRLRQAAGTAGDALPADTSLSVMLHRWEDDRSGISERYRLHYCAAFGLPPASFGTAPVPEHPPNLPPPDDIAPAGHADDAPTPGRERRNTKRPGAHGRWLREQREARGWSVTDMRSMLRRAATAAGDRLPGNDTVSRMIHGWETDQGGISERYRLHYCAAFGITLAGFGKEPVPVPVPHAGGTGPGGIAGAGQPGDVLGRLLPAQISPGGGELADVIRRLRDPASHGELCFLLGYATAMMTAAHQPSGHHPETPAGQPESLTVTGGTAISRAGSKHAYQQVADAVAARIAAGQYPCKLPRERALAQEFGVSYTTVRHAMAVLRERGLVETGHGRGTYIASAPGGGSN